MARIDRQTDPADWTICACCARPIRQLEDYQSIRNYLGKPSVRRRGFRCMNCGRVTCFKCSQNLFHCTCGTNAWVAMPYLESTATGTAVHWIV